jgi:hypothetical protein
LVSVTPRKIEDIAAVQRHIHDRARGDGLAYGGVDSLDGGRRSPNFHHFFTGANLHAQVQAHCLVNLQGRRVCNELTESRVRRRNPVGADGQVQSLEEAVLVRLRCHLRPGGHAGDGYFHAR